MEELRVITDIRNGKVVEPAFVSAVPSSGQQEALVLADLQRKIDQYIANIQGSNLPQEIKDSLIASLRGVQTSQNPSAINTVLAYAFDVQLMASSSETASEITYALVMGESDYNYSAQARRYMAATLREHVHRSPELQNLMKQLDALPAPVRAYAENEQKQNWQEAVQMLKDPSYAAYKEQLELYRGFALANTPEGKHILESIKAGVAPDQIASEVNHAVEARLKSTGAFIEKHVPRIPELSQKYLQEHFHKADGSLDAEAIQREWAKTRSPERDAAYKAMIEAGNDVTKLSLAQQRIIHMSQVMIAADAAAVAKGTLAIIERNAEIGKMLTDSSLSVSEREKTLVAELRKIGVSPNEQEAFLSAAREAVTALDDVKKRGIVYDPNDRSTFNRAFGTEYKDNLYEVAGIHKATQADVRRIDNAIEARDGVGYAGTTNFIVASRTDGDIPDYIKNDPVRFAAYQADQAYWKQYNSRVNTEVVPAQTSDASTVTANADNMAALKNIPGFPPGVGTNGVTYANGEPPSGAPTATVAAATPAKAPQTYRS